MTGAACGAVSKSVVSPRAPVPSTWRLMPFSGFSPEWYIAVAVAIGLG